MSLKWYEIYWRIQVSILARILRILYFLSPQSPSYSSSQTRRELFVALALGSCIYLFWNLSFVATAARCPFKDFAFLIYTFIHSNLNWDIHASFHFLTLHYQAGVTPNLLGLGYIPNQVMEAQGQRIKATHHPGPQGDTSCKAEWRRPINQTSFIHPREILNSLTLWTFDIIFWVCMKVLFIPNTKRQTDYSVWQIGFMEINVLSFPIPFFFPGGDGYRLTCIVVADILVTLPASVSGYCSPHDTPVIVPIVKAFQIISLRAWSNGHGSQYGCVLMYLEINWAWVPGRSPALQPPCQRDSVRLNAVLGQRGMRLESTFQQKSFKMLLSPEHQVWFSAVGRY